MRPSASCVPASRHQPLTRAERSRPCSAYQRLTSVISSSPREDGASPRMISKTSLRVAVEPDDRVARGRGVVARVDDARLLDDVGDAAVLAVDDHAEALRIRHLLDEDQRTVGIG